LVEGVLIEDEQLVEGIQATYCRRSRVRGQQPEMRSRKPRAQRSQGGRGDQQVAKRRELDHQNPPRLVHHRQF
jgi:hypothetical protein